MTAEYPYKPKRTATLPELAALLGGEARRELPNQSRILDVFSSTAEPVPGGIYAAIRGTAADGHNFVEKAGQLGALAAVVEEPSALGRMPGIVVSDSRAALSRLAAFFAGDPTKSLAVIGITGTNGKTTTHWLIYHALNSLGLKSIRIGTLGVEAKGAFSEEGSLTTPGPIELQRYFARALDAGCRAAVMEASSHALHQKRTANIKFDVGIFSNLTRDHLDYHKTMEDYFAAKELLFDQIAAGDSSIKAAVINLDDDYGLKAHEKFGRKLQDFSFGRDSRSRVRIKAFEESASGGRLTLEFEGQTLSADTGFIGSHNASNLASVVGALLALGIPFGDALKAAAQAPSVPGRLESVSARGIGVFVDYAHTPDALARALSAVRQTTKGKLYVVFGCGGDRDKGKRPIMGQTAAALADRVVITSDNPRTEDPQAIISEIQAAVPEPFLVDPDRRSAITKTLSSANAGDVILIAGKGHEDYQILGKEKIHFSDQEVVREYFREFSK